MESEKAFHALLTEPGRRLNLTARGRTFGGYFIGSKPAEYLVIELPRSSEIDEHLTEGRSVRGSFCASGEMIRFESSIIAFQKKPAWLLLLSYPSSLENIHTLRSSNRAECNIPCRLMTLSNLKEYTGLITNISAGGCRCILSSTSSNLTKLFKSDTRVLLEFNPANGGDTEKRFGEIHSLTRDGPDVSLGIKFNDDHDEAILKEFAGVPSNPT
jgi:hypothetical protein